MTGKECEMVLLVQADFDGELDPAQAASLQGHLTECAVCSAALAQLRQARELMRGEMAYHAAPDALRRKFQAAQATRTRPRLSILRQLPGFGLGLALAASLAVMMIPGREARMADELVSGHVRALQPGHLYDVASTDQHTVKPWFDGRIDFAPAVKNLADQGFPLVGGRIDYVDDRTVAAMVYQRRKHVIDLFAWPENETVPAPARASRNGYNIEHWAKDGMVYWAVSDLNEAELAEFHEAWKTGS